MGKFKTLGAILVAVLALSAIGASAAQAEGTFEAEEYTAGLVVEQTETLEFESEIGTMECEEVDMAGLMTEDASAISVVPEFEGCSIGGFEAIVEVNGCELTIHGGEEISSEEFDSPLDVCGSGESEAAAEITIVIPFTGCQITIKGQAGLGGLIVRPGGFFPPDLVIGVQVAKIDAMLENRPGKKCFFGVKKLPLGVHGGLTVGANGITPTVGLHLR